MKTMVLALMLAVCSFMGCEDDKDDNGNRSVTYSITGSAPTVNITMESEGGGTSQRSGQSLPWSLAGMGFGAGDFVYLSAQNQADHGTVTVTITRNGEVWKTATSTGAYVIATVSGSLD
jgi:hypothetical protein